MTRVGLVASDGHYFADMLDRVQSKDATRSSSCDGGGAKGRTRERQTIKSVTLRVV